MLNKICNERNIIVYYTQICVIWLRKNFPYRGRKNYGVDPSVHPRYVHVCVHECVCVCVCARIWVCECVCVCVCECEWVSQLCLCKFCNFVYVYVHECVCMCACVCACMCVHVCVHMCVRVWVSVPTMFVQIFMQFFNFRLKHQLCAVKVIFCFNIIFSLK